MTAINRNGTYAYCLEAIGKICTVSGWVDAEFFTRPTGEKAVEIDTKAAGTSTKTAP